MRNMAGACRFAAAATIAAADEVADGHRGPGGDGARAGFPGIVSVSREMERVLSTVQAVAPTDLPVLITGETGTGKELIARAVHRLSRRCLDGGDGVGRGGGGGGGRFVAVDCAAGDEALLDDQLFGHVRGAFTGADRDREGVFEYAHRGTLFLDEIGDMPARMQAKPLRALESGEVVRVGSNAPRAADVRLVSATSRDLGAMVDAGGFRRDLYYRIRGAEIRIPPLRARREDIPGLVRHAIARFGGDGGGGGARGITGAAMLRLTAYDWPGNVRQLLSAVRDMLARAAATDGDGFGGRDLDVGDLPEEIAASEDAAAAAMVLADGGGVGSLAGATLEQLEARAIRDTLRHTGGNRCRAAAMLGIGLTTLYRKLRAYDLT